MIDLHTHLLPDWDDGAGSWEEFRAMAGIAHADGIGTIVLTPHVFRLSKHADDLNVLESRFAEVAAVESKTAVAFLRGAEIFLHPGVAETAKTWNLTINASNYFFLEFPEDAVPPGVREFFFEIMLGGLTPIISHPERNDVFRERPDLLYDLIRTGALAQVTAKSITGGFGAETKKTARLFLKHNLVQVIASDAHDPERRPPRLAAAVEEAGAIVGREKALAMVTDIPRAILDNAPIPDWGVPENPARKRKWTLRLPKFA